MEDIQTRTPEQEIQRAREAERLINSPMFREAAQSIEKWLCEQRRAVGAADTDGHTRLILTEQLFYSFLDVFKAIMQDGELAQLEVTRKESWRGRLAAMLTGDPREPV